MKPVKNRVFLYLLFYQKLNSNQIDIILASGNFPISYANPYFYKKIFTKYKNLSEEQIIKFLDMYGRSGIFLQPIKDYLDFFSNKKSDNIFKSIIRNGNIVGDFAYNEIDDFIKSRNYFSQEFRKWWRGLYNG